MTQPKKIKLTDAFVTSLAPPATGQSFTWDLHTQGLGVRCTANGSKAYIAQGQCNGKTVRVTLARVNEIDVKEARARTSAATLMMRDGTNPVQKKRAHKVESQTLQQVLDDYLENRRTAFGPLRDSTKQNMSEHVRRYLSDWADKPIGKLSHTLVAQRFHKISAHAPVQANIVMGTLRCLCTYAANKSIGPDGVPTLLPFNPVVIAFKGLAKYNHVKPKTRRIPINKTGAVWALLQGRLDLTYHPRGDAQNAALLIGLILTGARFNELAQLKWDNVFLDDDDPYIQFVETKMHRTLKLPITTQLETLLRMQLDRREPRNPYVFVGRTRKTHIKSPYQTLKHVSTAAGIKISAHDLRRGLTQAGHTIGIQKHIIDLLTGHLSNDVTIRHYTETEDLRCYRDDAQKIANWFEQQGAIHSGANVVALTTGLAA